MTKLRRADLDLIFRKPRSLRLASAKAGKLV